MSNFFLITGNDGEYRLQVKPCCKVTTVLGIDTLTYGYFYGFWDNTPNPDYDMWTEEFEYLFGPMDGEGFSMETDYAVSPELALAAAITRLKNAIATYESWPHSLENPYIPE